MLATCIDRFEQYFPPRRPVSSVVKDRNFSLVFKEFRTAIRTRGEQQSRLTGYPSRFSSSCLTVYIYCLPSPHLPSKWNTEETYLGFIDMDNWKTPVQMKQWFNKSQFKIVQLVGASNFLWFIHCFFCDPLIVSRICPMSHKSWVLRRGSIKLRTR